jgi:hypothetical protein
MFFFALRINAKYGWAVYMFLMKSSATGPLPPW